VTPYSTDYNPVGYLVHAGYAAREEVQTVNTYITSLDELIQRLRME